MKNYPKYYAPAAEDRLQFRPMLRKLSRRWFWFPISLLVCMVAAFYYIYVTNPLYEVTSTLLLMDEGQKYQPFGTQGDSESTINMFATTNNIMNEIGVISSYDMVRSALEELNFAVEYYEKDGLREYEIYKKAPFELFMDVSVPQLINTGIFIDFISPEEVRISIEEPTEYSIHDFESGSMRKYEKALSYSEVFNTGSMATSEYFSFRIFPEENMVIEPNSSKRYFVKMRNYNQITKGRIKKLTVAPTDFESTIVELKVSGESPSKEIDFLNALTSTYIEKKLDEKNNFASGTIQFIDNQLGQVEDSLRRVESQMAAFSRSNETLNIESKAAEAQIRLRQLETERDQIRLKSQYYGAVLSQLKNNNVGSINAPSSMGLNDPILNNLIIELKDLNTQRIELQYKVAEGSFELDILQRKIANVKNNLVANVQSLVNNNDITLRDVNARIARVQAELIRLPGSKVNLDNIQRLVAVNDNLHQFLLQKRAEAAIAKAASSSDSKVLDDARLIGVGPYWPNPLVIYALAIFLGLALPASVILMVDYFNDTITDPEQIEAVTSIPLLASIIKDKKAGLINYENLNSPIAESFRYLRVNLQFLAVDQTSKVIGVTSTVPAEGKTFCALNFASIMALSGHKTLIIGADIRKPKMFERSNVKNEVGLSSYLINQATLDEIIQSSDLDNLDIIPSGPIPPNPAELLNTDKFRSIFDILKSTYEYIIVDTPPVGLVSDYLAISNILDVSLYVVRYKYSKLSFVKDLDKFKKKNKVKNLYILLNGVNINDSKYGKYGKYGSYGTYKSRFRYSYNGSYRIRNLLNNINLGKTKAYKQ